MKETKPLLIDLTLTQGFWPAVRSGTKRYTIRLGARHYAKEITIHFGEYKAQAIVNSQEVHTLMTIPLEILVIDGFISIFDVLQKLGKYYPKIKLTDVVTVVEFYVI